LDILRLHCVTAHDCRLRVGPSQSEALRVGMGGLACVSARFQPIPTHWYALYSDEYDFEKSALSRNHP